MQARIDAGFTAPLPELGGFPVGPLRSLPPPRAADGACLRDMWVLAVGDSVLRLAFANLVERLTNTQPPKLAGCMPDWRYLNPGVCKPNGAVVP